MSEPTAVDIDWFISLDSKLTTVQKSSAYSVGRAVDALKALRIYLATAIATETGRGEDADAIVATVTAPGIRKSTGSQ